MKKKKEKPSNQWLARSRRDWIRCAELQQETIKKLAAKVVELEKKIVDLD